MGVANDLWSTIYLRDEKMKRFGDEEATYTPKTR